MQSTISGAWKTAIIKMIPKKSVELDNPKSYRPISMTSCLGKLLEKFILARIQNHLKKHKIILKQQSGFKAHRQTKDNLVFLIQKIQESFVRKKKVMSFFFDISQAFDKVWCDGLLSKLITIKLPVYLIKWLQFYLNNRNFVVKLENCSSTNKPIKCGVPQGAVLSPTLFSIYIKEIPVITCKNKSYSLLFADDVVTFLIYKNPGHVNTLVAK